MSSLKTVVLGDSAVGKTCLLLCFTTNGFPDKYIPTEFDVYHTQIMIDGKKWDIELSDTSGRDDDKLRSVSYPKMDIFLLCFSLVSPESLNNIKDKWIPEIIQNGQPNPLYLLIGTKSDLKNKKAYQDNVISQEEIDWMIKECDIHGYISTSTFDKIAISQTFEKAIKMKIQKDRPKTSSCCQIL